MSPSIGTISIHAYVTGTQMIWYKPRYHPTHFDVVYNTIHLVSKRRNYVCKFFRNSEFDPIFRKVNRVRNFEEMFH